MSSELESFIQQHKVKLAQEKQQVCSLYRFIVTFPVIRTLFLFVTISTLSDKRIICSICALLCIVITYLCLFVCLSVREITQECVGTCRPESD